MVKVFYNPIKFYKIYVVLVLCFSINIWKQMGMKPPPTLLTYSYSTLLFLLPGHQATTTTYLHTYLLTKLPSFILLCCFPQVRGPTMCNVDIHKSQTKRTTFSKLHTTTIQYLRQNRKSVQLTVCTLRNFAVVFVFV